MHNNKKQLFMLVFRYMKFLGVDFGSKKLGLAISDENGILAFPKKVIPNDNSTQVVIKEYIESEKIEAIVFGESLDSFGKPNKIMQEINEFVPLLKKEISIPIYFQKEFMTSVEARGREGKEIFSERKIKKEKYTDPVDAKAAALILQRYLDKINKK